VAESTAETEPIHRCILTQKSLSLIRKKPFNVLNIDEWRCKVSRDGGGWILPPRAVSPTPSEDANFKELREITYPESIVVAHGANERKALVEEIKDRIGSDLESLPTSEVVSRSEVSVSRSEIFRRYEPKLFALPLQVRIV
jgi:hypothetical protein